MNARSFNATSLLEARRRRRDGFDQDVRLQLVEEDADEAAVEWQAFKQEIRDEIRALKALMLSVAVTALSATIVGAINLALGKIG